MLHEQNDSLKKKKAVVNIDIAPMMHINIFLSKIAACTYLKLEAATCEQHSVTTTKKNR